MTPGDERFAQSMADLSSRLRDRMARQRPTDPITALKDRQAALKAFDRERRQKLYVIAGGLGCIVAAGALAWGIVMFAQPDQAATAMPNRTATAVPVTPPPATPSPPPEATPSPPPAKLASATTPPAEARPPVPPAPVTSPAPVTIESTTVPAPDRKQVSPPVPDQAEAKPVEQAAAPVQDPNSSSASSADRPPPTAPALSRTEVAEVQQLLAEFGFNPGPVDGSAGPRTLDAVSRYQAQRGLPQTGALDSGLLRQLRKDPAPKTEMVAQRPPPAYTPPPRYAQSTTFRTPAVFRPVEMAGQQITTWLNSVFH